MEPLNFCRQMRKQFTSQIASGHVINQTMYSHCIDLAGVSQKFILPEGGRLLDDNEFRALNENEEIRLPFEYIALEYRKAAEQAQPGETNFSKSIVFARERSDHIAITVVSWADEIATWIPYPEVAIPRIRCIDRSAPMDGTVPVRVVPSNAYKRLGLPVGDVMCEVGALVSFLNALSCSNVRSERLNTPKKKVKSALPFDEYKILTIDCPKGSAANGHCHDGVNRSPREHLRRGHIRRLEDGRRLWINATVVNAGKGGKISKEYGLRDPRIAGIV